MKTIESKPSRVELMRMVCEILETNSNDPIAEMRKTGQAMVEIADTLSKSGSLHDARATMKAVAALQGFERSS